MMGRSVPVRRVRMGVPQALPPTCGPNEQLTIKVVNLQEQWVCEPVGGPAPAPGCQIPAGISFDHPVYVCPKPDGTFDIIDGTTLGTILASVSQDCVNSFSHVTTLDPSCAIGRGGGPAPAPVPAPSPTPPPPPPAPTPAPTPTPSPACNVPAGYEPLPGGGVAVDHSVWACPKPDGTYDLINVRSMEVVAEGVSRECVDLFGDVTFMDADQSPCNGPAVPATSGPCTLPTDEPVILCPPSNGITAEYYVNARTGSYERNMTTQPPSCKDQPNVIKVGANSPYCGGSNVSGEGSDLPSMVACHVSPGMGGFQENVVSLHNGSDMAILEQSIMVKDIAAKYPGRRWIYVTGLFCSELPDFGITPAVPAPAPAPAPPAAPPPAAGPEPSPAPSPMPSPTPTPVEPIPGQRVAIVIIPPPSPARSPCDAGSWLTQYKVGPSSPALGRGHLRRGIF